MDVKQWLGENNTLGLSIWENKYRYENETFDEWLDRVSNDDEELKQLIIEKKFLFGGRILANRGLDELGRKVTYSNCYVLPQVEDSIESIYKTCSDLARTFSYGGGCGIDISKLRPINSFVNNTARKTSGACSFMDTFSQVTETIGQNGRRGALMISMDCSHPEIIDFINIKTDLERVTKANISVKITNDFMKAVKEDGNWELYFKTEHEEIKKIVKAKEIFRLLCKNNWDFAEPGILFWDRISNYNLLSEDKEFEYAGTNPCAEEPLPAGGSCLLGAINLAEYVVNKRFDYESFKRDIHVVVKAMDEVLDQGLPLHPLQIQRDTVRDYRQIGIGIMGLADMLIKMEHKYDTIEAVYLCDEIGFAMANEVIKANALLAKEKGVYPKYNRYAVLDSEFIKANTDRHTYSLVEEYGLRNSQVLTIAPTGSISTMIQVSGGIEPIFSFSYDRKTESLHGEERHYKIYTKIVKDYMEENGLTEEEDLPNFFVNAQTIDPFKRIDMQGIWQEHIDASISSTVNLPNETTVEDVEDLYMYAWERGLKGMTIFRDGCARLGILTLDNKENEKTEEEEIKELRRGEIVPTNDSVIGLKRKISGGCGSLHVQAFFDEETGEMTEVFINKGGSGGCNSNLNALSRMISIALRGGVKIEDIADQLASTINCPSFASARAKGLPLSQGSSCPSAVGRVLIEMNKDFQEMFKSKKANKEDILDDKKEDKELCPECKEPLTRTGGCVQCPNCSWSKCD